MDGESLEGYVVDLICLRKYPQDELAERAREHTRECALHGHCIESGYGLVDEKGTVRLLDPHATPDIVRTLRESAQEEGIWLRVDRQPANGEMQTGKVTETPGG